MAYVFDGHSQAAQLANKFVACCIYLGLVAAQHSHVAGTVGMHAHSHNGAQATSTSSIMDALFQGIPAVTSLGFRLGWQRYACRKAPMIAQASWHAGPTRCTSQTITVSRPQDSATMHLSAHVLRRVALLHAQVAPVRPTAQRGAQLDQLDLPEPSGP